MRLIKNTDYSYYLSQSNMLNSIHSSKSQLFQDIFTLSELDFMTKGYFVEFGSTDGILHSNTFILEKKFDWDGILVEPSKQFHKDLQKNRSCSIDKRCVFSESGKNILFYESELGELSTIDHYQNDRNYLKKSKGYKYEVETISLIDLLDNYNAPKVIDYLSIDTEGSEYDILNAFDFNKYKFKIITVEHNYLEDKRNNINKLLEHHGYEKVYDKMSLWDDWYVYKGNL